MKNKKIFGIIAVFAFAALLFASRHSYNEDAGPAPDVVEVAIAQPDSVALPAIVVTPVKSIDAQVADARVCVKDFFKANLKVREKTNSNDGKAIDNYFRTIGWKNPQKLKARDKSWCGAFMGSAWLSCLDHKPHWVKNKAELAQVSKWKKGPNISKKEALIGDAVTLTSHSHVEGVYDRHPNPTFKFFESCGGNTSAPRGDSDTRQGVHVKTRSWQEINHVISLRKTLMHS